MSELTLLFNTSWQGYIAPAAALAAVLAAVAGYWFWGRDKRLKAEDKDRIPDELSALELGTVVDGIVQGEDLGVQLFDWANRGYLSLALEKDGWHIDRTGSPDGTARPYEREAWDMLFDHDRLETVNPARERKRMLQTAQILQRGAETLFESGEKRIMNAVSSRIALAVWCIGVACLLAAGALAGWQMGFSAYGIAPMAIATALPAMLASWLSGWFQRFYQLRSRKRNYLVVATILMADIVMILLVDSLLLAVSPIQPWVLTPLICAGVFCAMMAPFVGRRSSYGHRLLCEVMGFGDALAEGERLPAKMEQESRADYFFRMLPYAQVLGAGESFAKKYGDAPLEVPGWLKWERAEPLTAKALLACLVDIRDQLVNDKDDSVQPEEI